MNYAQIQIYTSLSNVTLDSFCNREGIHLKKNYWDATMLPF